jgi:hypothetical protein
MKKLIGRTSVFCTFTLGACNDNLTVVDFLCGDVVNVDRALYDITTSPNNFK